MPEHNLYAPPVDNSSPIAMESTLRSDYGFKLSASLWWRVLLLQLVVTMPVHVIFLLLDLGDSLSWLKLKPSLFFAAVAIAIAISMQLLRPGLLFLVWGHRLRISPQNWRKFSWSLCGLYGLLGAANVYVAVVASVEFWVKFKTFAPFLAIITFCAVAPRFLVRPRSS